MLSLLARIIGGAVILGLAVVGADSIAQKLLSWKDSHDRLPGNRTVTVRN